MISRRSFLITAATLGAAGAHRTDAAVRSAMKAWSVPGVAVVIVRDDAVVYLQGHGVRAAGRPEAVTPDTLFALSSCSKAFTTAAMAILADEGKLGWDDPVRKHLPWFRLADPLADREVRLRDLLCHRTGLGQHELLWYRAPWPPEEAIRRAGLLPLEAPFRTRLVYQSTMVTAAGLAAARAAGTSWADLIRKRLLDPLQMKRTCLDNAAALESADVARPHRLDRAGEPEVIPGYRSPHPDPAVSIHTSARDLGAWLRFHLAAGLAGDKRLVSARQLEQTHTPQMVMRLTPNQESLFPATTQHSYALGWVVHDHHGVRLISHGGAIDGFRCHITFAPQKKLGVAVLANLDLTPMTLALANTLVDQQLGLPKRDWHALSRAARKRLQEGLAEKQRQRLARRKYGTTPSRELAAYTGDYEHPAYGTAKVALQRGRLVWRWRDEEAVLEHFHYNTFTAANDLVEDPDLTFALDRQGAVAEFAITGKLGVVFRRKLK